VAVTDAEPTGAHTGGYEDMRSYIEALEAAGLLKHVTAEVDLKHEIGAIAARSLEQGGPAIVFENVKGYPGMPLVVNLVSNNKQLGLAFGTESEETKIYEKLVLGMRNRIPSRIRQTGPVKEEIYQGDDVDLYKFPTPWWHEHDGGQFIATTAGLITQDPATGNLNMGSYRAMIKDKNTVSWSGGTRKPGSGSGGDVILANEAEGKPTPVAIVLGMDPYLSLATGSPVPADEEGQTEYEAAGAWRGAATELVKCETNDLLVPANAEIVLEGEAIPNERTEEGPHGESTGFYGENKQAFVIKINCVTHRHNPVSYGLICQLIEDYPRQLFRSGSFLTRLTQASGMDNIREAYFPEVGRMGMMIVSAAIRDKDDPKRIMDAVWALDNWRWVIVVDEDCDVRNWNDVMWRVVSAADPDRQEVIFGKQHELRAAPRTDENDYTPPRRGMGIDATMRFKPQNFPPVNKVSRELTNRVAARWDELGLE
jgi:UbiD family decarboxylase